MQEFSSIFTVKGLNASSTEELKHEKTCFSLTLLTGFNSISATDFKTPEKVKS